MSNLLEITGDDVARLNDADLRTLIGLLCEADYRLAGLPTRGITWGGRQEARDGGLDVVVRDELPPPSNSFVPRNVTGFQIKKPDMPRAEILKEMRPKDVLREEIKGLIGAEGAYIIVSSSGSTTVTALKNRVDAMKEAVANEADHENLCLDFMDQGRVATWVRSHPSLILWVRTKTERPLAGWRPFENWANAPGGIEEEYLFDEGLRLHDGTNKADKGFSVEAGLLKLRSVLSTPGTSARLAGLSGIGKTRLVQALFDERVGEHALNPAQAFYTDISDSPVPDPGTLANQLINDKTRAVLVVDNCPPDLHHRLTQICSRPESTVSLLTVEYDVRDDLPEETTVFRLEPASEGIIEQLIRKHFSHVSQVDARTIAGFSGGNARVAISLANTVQQGETLSGFRDEALFERLFRQRNDPSDNLLRSAEVCSLVYSFEGTDTISETAELKFLASLVNKSSADLYRDVAELKKRDLVQSRGVWRAVLPHAIANRLARRALESIPKDVLVRKFVAGVGSERLIRSFTRRLSFLHDADTAIEIVTDWLGSDGWIGKTIRNLNTLGISVLRNIAPVAPEKALEAIERAANGLEGVLFTSRDNSHYAEFVRLLRHLAYDPPLFHRSIELMVRFALSESEDEKDSSTRAVLKSLFYIYLSGTHASLEAREAVIEALVSSDNQNKQNLGILLLDASLETWHFSSVHEFDFGARLRDFGYEPRTRQEYARWFGTLIGRCTRLALSGQPIAERAKKLLADNLRGLWTNAGMFDVLEESASQIQAKDPWNDGWIAVREILRYDSKNFNDAVRQRLDRLEKLLKPVNLLEQARTFALSDRHGSLDLEDDWDDTEKGSVGWSKAEKMTWKIGTQVAQSVATLKVLLPDLVSTNGTRLHSFGRGLADGCSDKREMFDLLHAEIGKISPEKRNPSVVLGFLSASAISDPSFFNSILDTLVYDDVLGRWFPVFQTTSTIDQRGIERLHEALDHGKAQIHTFRYLAEGRAHEAINDDELARLLRKILLKENGIGVVIEILTMRSHGRKKEYPRVSNSLIVVMRELLTTYTFDEKHRGLGNQDGDLADLVDVCLNGEESLAAATQIAQKLAAAIAAQQAYAFDYPKLLDSLAKAQPIVFLDVFLGGIDREERKRGRMFSRDLVWRGNPLNQIPDTDLLSWCDKDAAVRYPIIVAAIHPFTKSGDSGKLEWKSVVYTILEKAPELDAILEPLANSIRPSSWSSSLADILMTRTILFQELYNHDNAKIRAWARAQHLELLESIREQREWEEQRHRERNERFE